MLPVLDALTLDQLTQHPSWPLISEWAREHTSTHLLDQGDAATEDAAEILEVITALTGGKTAELNPGDLPGWLRLSVLHAWSGFINSTADTCTHSPSWDRPEPVFAAAWRPDLIVCTSCLRLLHQKRGSVADRTCDGCGHVCAGPDEGDGIFPGSIRLGPLVYQYGACGTCRAEVRM
jgi:hypothetical protein